MQNVTRAFLEVLIYWCSLRIVLLPPYQIYDILYGETAHMRTYLRALVAGEFPVMNELLHAAEPSFECEPQNLEDIFRRPLLCPIS